TGVLCQRARSAARFIERVFAFHKRNRKRDAVVESAYREHLGRVADFGFANGRSAGWRAAFIFRPVEATVGSLRALRRPRELIDQIVASTLSILPKPLLPWTFHCKSLGA